MVIEIGWLFGSTLTQFLIVTRRLLHVNIVIKLTCLTLRPMAFLTWKKTYQNVSNILTICQRTLTETVLQFSTTEGAGLAAVSTRFDQAECWYGLAVYIIQDEQPFTTVEKERLKYFCLKMQPQFDIPSRWTLASDCFQL